MTNKRYIRSATMIAFLATLVASRVALAVTEVEPNDPVANAQPLVVGSDGTVTVNGGILNTPTHRDVDFYSIQATKGDVVTINIDGGMDANFVGVWTVVAIFGPNTTTPVPLLDQSSTGIPIDAGSASPYDARIDNFVIPQTGTYIVGVSSEPAEFIDVDHISSPTIWDYSPALYVDGTYTLIISGVTPPASVPPIATPPVVQQISIEIRPGRRDVFVVSSRRDFDSKKDRVFKKDRDSDSARRHDSDELREHFRGGIPVALLSSDTFNALDVDQTSLKFGGTGTEDSLIRCNPHGVDVNGDKLPDLICHFDYRKANFQPGDTEGIVTGKTNSGDAFEGKGFLKIVPSLRHFPR